MSDPTTDDGAAQPTIDPTIQPVSGDTASNGQSEQPTVDPDASDPTLGSPEPSSDTSDSNQGAPASPVSGDASDTSSPEPSGDISVTSDDANGTNSTDTTTGPLKQDDTNQPIGKDGTSLSDPEPIPSADSDGEDAASAEIAASAVQAQVDQAIAQQEAENPPDTTPVISDEPEIDTAAAPAATDVTTARTPQFHARRTGGFLFVLRAGYIGDPLMVSEDEVDELIQLLHDLKEHTPDDGESSGD